MVRDYERLQELSSTISAGLAAGEVVIAVDQVMSGRSLDDQARLALVNGADLLRRIADPDADFAASPKATQSLMSPGTAIGALEAVHLKAPPDVAEFLNRLAAALEQSSDASSSAGVEAELKEALELFSVLGDVELARANRVARTGQEPMAWLSSKTTSRS